MGDDAALVQGEQSPEHLTYIQEHPHKAVPPVRVDLRENQGSWSSRKASERVVTYDTDLQQIQYQKEQHVQESSEQHYQHSLGLIQDETYRELQEAQEEEHALCLCLQQRQPLPLQSRRDPLLHPYHQHLRQKRYLHCLP